VLPYVYEISFLCDPPILELNNDSPWFFLWLEPALDDALPVVSAPPLPCLEPFLDF
jgi:hypothetical protein